MRTDELLIEPFQRIRALVARTAQDLDSEALLWRPDPEANSIAWLLWHLTRIQDDHVAEIAGREQVWVVSGWAERFGMPAGAMDTGYGHSAAQVAAIAPDGPQPLLAYHEEVAEQTASYLADVDDGDLERVIDRSFDPPVTVGVRLVSVLCDGLQHVGQAAYLRGLFERRG